MKKRLLAIMNEKGLYLEEFKPNNNKVLAFGARFVSDFEHALTVNYDEVKGDLENTRKLIKWATLCKGELVVIEIDYQVKELKTDKIREEFDASKEEAEIEKIKQDLFTALFGGDNNED